MKLAPDDISYLQQKAGQVGYNPDDMLRVINYESSGDPTRWGGKGGNYFGLFQAGPDERKQFGVDTQNPNAKNQIDAFIKFLDARGFKPGMPLIDLYSTVNAGSPGHYNASDGNGTVASHVAKMMGQPVQLSGGLLTNPQGEAPVPMSGLLSSSGGGLDLPGLPNMSRGFKPVSAEEEEMPAGKMVQPIAGEPHRPTKEQIKKLRTRGLLG